MDRMDNLLKAANAGDAQAQFEVGLEYFNQKEYIKAAYYYQLAVEQGHTGAMNNLGLMYFSGDFLRKNLDKVESLLKVAVDKKDETAQMSLALFYLASDDEEKYKIAVSILEDLTQKGSKKGFYGLGEAYLTGKGVEMDFAKAIQYYKLAADAGDADAMFELGQMYQFGLSVDGDEEEAERFYKMAIENGHEKAVYNLAFLYNESARDEEEIQLYNKQIDKGCKYVQFHLAYKYHRGRGIEKDIDKAIHLYKLAANQGEDSAKNNLATLYALTGIPEKIEAAKKLLEDCSKTSEAVELNLALVYDLMGEREKAITLYEKLSKNHQIAHYNLTIMRNHPRDDETNVYNPEKVIGCYKKCGKIAYNNLAIMYAAGVGVNQDINTAIELLKKAVDNGDVIAKENLELLERVLPINPDTLILERLLRVRKSIYEFNVESLSTYDKELMEYIFLCSEACCWDKVSKAHKKTEKEKGRQ